LREAYQLIPISARSISLDKDPNLKRSEGRIRIRNDPDSIRIRIRNNSFGSTTLQVHGQLLLQVQKNISVIQTKLKYFNPKRIDL